MTIPTRWWQRQRQRHRQRHTQRCSMSIHVLGILSLTYVLLSLQLYGLKLLTVNDIILGDTRTTNSSITDGGSHHYVQPTRYQKPPSPALSSVTKSMPAPPNCPIPVYILPQKDDPDDNMHGEHRHFVLDGIEKSPYFELTTTTDDGPAQSKLWIIDLHRLRYQCEVIHERIYEAAKKQSRSCINYHKNNTSTINDAPMTTVSEATSPKTTIMINLTRWTIMFLDWSDYPGFEDPCNVTSIINNITNGIVNDIDIDIEIDKIDVRYGVRSIVDRGPKFIETHFDGISSTFNKTYNRGWRRKATMKDWYLHVNESSSVVAVKEVTTDQNNTEADDQQQPYQQQHQPYQQPYQHMSYHVRTDHIETLRKIITNEMGQATSRKEQQATVPNRTIDDDSDRETNGTSTTSTATTSWPYETWDPNSLDRPVDVCHMWSNKWHDNDRKYNAEIRDLVSHTLGKMKHSHEYKNNMTFYVGLRGPVGSAGRRRPQYLYAQQLLKCKIVVVVGRDTHEDHYRLMESLSSGAMVLSEPMLRPPPGLVQGQHWDIFTSRTELQTMIRYYVLENPNRRKDIARNGWRFVMKSYRSWHFIEKLVSGGTVWSNSGMKDPSIESNSSNCIE